MMPAKSKFQTRLQRAILATCTRTRLPYLVPYHDNLCISLDDEHCNRPHKHAAQSPLVSDSTTLPISHIISSMVVCPSSAPHSRRALLRNRYPTSSRSVYDIAT